MKKLIPFIVCIAFLIPHTTHAARVTSVGAELQSATAGVEFTLVGFFADANNGIDTSVFRSGAASVKENVSASFSWFEVQSKSAVNANEVFVRAYYKFTTLPGSGTVDLMLFGDTAPSKQARIYYDGASGTIKAEDDTPTLIGTSAAVTTGKWYCVVADIKGGAGSGTVKAYVDEDGVNNCGTTQFANSTTAQVGNFNRTYFGPSFNTATVVMNIDDVAINDTTGTTQTGIPGSGKIIMLKPDSAGDVNTFATQTGGTAGAANNFTRVNETPPNDATSFNGSSAVNQEDLFNMGASGIGSSDTVNVVGIGGRFRNSTADATGSFKFEVEKTGSGTKSQSSAIIPNSVTWKTNGTTAAFGYPIMSTTDPDGAAWTQTTLDSMQTGYIDTANPGTAGRRNDITVVFAMVDYTPGVAPVTSGPSIFTILMPLIIRSQMIIM